MMQYYCSNIQIIIKLHVVIIKKYHLVSYVIFVLHAFVLDTTRLLKKRYKQHQYIQKIKKEN